MISDHGSPPCSPQLLRSRPAGIQSSTGQSFFFLARIHRRIYQQAGLLVSGQYSLVYYGVRPGHLVSKCEVEVQIGSLEPHAVE